MQGTYTIGELFKFLLKRWWLILVAAIVFGAGMGIYKSGKVANVSAPTEIVSSQLVEFKNHATYIDATTGNQKYQNYNDIWFRNSVLSEFVELADQNFEMCNFNAQWDNMSELNKADWLREVITCSPMSNTPNYEFSFTVSVHADQKEYALAQSEPFLKSFIDYATQSTKILSKDSQYVVLNQATQIAEGNVNSGMKKYVVLGVLLGGLLSVFIIFIQFLYSSKVVSKSIIASKYAPDFVEGKNALYDTVCYMIREAGQSDSPVITICSAWNNKDVAMENVIKKFADLNNRIAVANISGRDISLPKQENLTALSGTEINNLLVPGKIANTLEALKADYDYVLLLSPTPAENAAVIEQADNSSCIVFLEKFEKSSKKLLDNSLQKLENTDTAVCVAWL